MSRTMTSRDRELREELLAALEQLDRTYGTEFLAARKSGSTRAVARVHGKRLAVEDVRRLVKRLLP